MKPVTEDQVQALLSGLEQREKEALRALSKQTADMTNDSGRMTAKILKLQDLAKKRKSKDDVVEMVERRKDRRRRISSKGYFYYAAEPRRISTP